jgi:hypothetical protein
MNPGSFAKPVKENSRLVKKLDEIKFEKKYFKIR